MDLVEVLGKQDRKVPVLLTASMTRAVEVLIDTRVSAGIPHGNPYVFANVSIRIDFPCLFRYSVCCHMCLLHSYCIFSKLVEFVLLTIRYTVHLQD